MVIFFLKIKYAYLAQLVEQGTENPCVLGSIPRRGKFFMREPCVEPFEKRQIVEI